MTSRGADASSLLLRLGIGLIFLLSGLEKVVRGTAATSAYFTDLGIPWPDVLGPVVSYLELLGGIGLLVGLGTRLWAALFVAEMVVALAAARLPVAATANSLTEAAVAVRLEALIAVASGCLVLLGGGRWSIDRAFRRHVPSG